MNKLSTKSLLMATTASLSTMPAFALEETSAAAAVEDVNLEEIVVTSSAMKRKITETVSGVTVLTKEKLARSLQGTLGETLARTPGVSSTFFGPGASRPVIRGLGASRILMLDNGLGAIDASNVSPDHAVSVEPALAERIEVLRGTSMLMYGSSAAGGVVNVIDGRIPTAKVEGGLTGAARVGYSHNTRGVEGAASLTGNLWENDDKALVFYLGGSARDSGDYRIPGYAESEIYREAEEHEDEHHGEEHHGEEHHEEEHEEEMFGIIDNSYVKSQSANIGLSYTSFYGFLGMNLKVFGTDYGIAAGHSHHHEEEEEGHEEEGHEEEHGEEEISIDMDQIRFDMMGSLKIDSSWISQIDLRFGYADYEHVENEGDEVGTTYYNEGYELRLDVNENYTDAITGRSGFLFKTRTLDVVGEEAFLPKVEANQFGLYTMKEWRTGDLIIDAGARYERTDYESTEGVSRSFDSLSVSGSTGYRLSDANFIGGTLFYTEKAPALEELYANGPHLATTSYEIGDLDLQLEKATGTELTFRRTTESMKTEITAYMTRYVDFIYNRPTVLEEDELPVYFYRQANVLMKGIELSNEVHLGDVMGFDVHLTGQLDYVRVKRSNESADNRNLPYIPPFSSMLGLEGTKDNLFWRVEMQSAANQDYTAPAELPTEGYTLVNAYLTYKPFADQDISVDLKAKNIFDAEARQHTSALKDLLPQPGRDIQLSVRVAF